MTSRKPRANQAHEEILESVPAAEEQAPDEPGAEGEIPEAPTAEDDKSSGEAHQDPESGIGVIVHPAATLGRTTIADEVVSAVAGNAALEIEGVAAVGSNTVGQRIAGLLGRADRRGHGVEVVSGQRETIVDITITVSYGANIPSVAKDVKERIYLRVREICGLVSKEVNVTVSGIEF